jgi:hypothetical protein
MEGHTMKKQDCSRVDDKSRAMTVRHSRRYGLSRCLLLTGFLIFSVATAHAGYFGSIAYNERNGASGFSYDYSSQRDADQRALAECGKQGSGCKVVKQFANGCAAYARGTQGAFGSGTALTKKAAQNHAVGACKRYGNSCEVIVYACSVPPMVPSNPGQPGAPRETTYDQMMRECRNAGGGNLIGGNCVRF